MKQDISLISVRRLGKGDIFIIAANLLPLLGVAFWGWNPIEAFTVYALETLIVGLLTLLKMLLVTFYKGKDTWHNGGQTTTVSGLFFMAFFTVHYGLFAGIQTAIFSAVSKIGPSDAGPLYFFLHWYEFVNRDIGFMLAAFIISYLINNFVPFVLSGEYKTVPMMKLMFQPYGRIIIQQFTVIVGSMLLVFKLGLGFMIVFVAVKLYFDLFINFDKILDKAMVDDR